MTHDAGGEAGSVRSRVLVTGGAGFIGSHLVDELLESGYAVRVYDDFSTGKRENLAHVVQAGAKPARARADDRPLSADPDHPSGDVPGPPLGDALPPAHDLEVIVGDVRDFDALREAMRGCSACVHLAAVASVTDSYARLDEVNCINVGGTVKVLRAARELGVGRVVFASSCAVYGDTDALPIDEATATRPLSPYAVGKLAGEGYLRSIAQEELPEAGDSALDTLSFRFFNVFGPRQDAGSPYSGVIAAFMAAAAARRDCIVHGDGEQTRDFVYVRDITRALAAAVARDGRFGGSIVNLGSGVETSVNDIVAAVRRVSGADLPQRAGEARSGDIRRSRGDASRAAEVLDWRASVAFAEGLERTWEWYAGQTSTNASPRRSTMKSDESRPRLDG